MNPDKDVHHATYIFRRRKFWEQKSYFSKLNSSTGFSSLTSEKRYYLKKYQTGNALSDLINLHMEFLLRFMTKK